MSYEQFYLLFGQKDQVFVPQDMPRHIQGTKTPTILFEKQPEGRDRFLRLFIQST